MNKYEAGTILLYMQSLKFGNHQIIKAVFPTSARGQRFHLLLGAEELTTLMQNIPISLIFVNETHTIKVPATLSVKLCLLYILREIPSEAEHVINFHTIS